MNLSNLLKLFCCLALAVSCAARADDVDLTKAVDSLVEAEKGYAKLGAEKGFRAASLANLSDDAVIFAPRMTNGKKFWQEAKEDPFITWRPIFASIARSAELGYTTGPSEYRNARSDKEPAAFGHFVSIWQKDAKGMWKVDVDVGVNHPQPAALPGDLTTQIPKAVSSSSDSARASLEKTQRGFAEALKKDERDAILDVASPDIRIYRRGVLPSVRGHKSTMEKMFEIEHAKTSRTPMGAGTSTAIDLAYEYGEYASDHDKETQRGIYLCIWQMESDGDWKLVLDLQKSAPPEKK